MQHWLRLIFVPHRQCIEIKTLLIVAHSQSGHSFSLALAFYHAAKNHNDVDVTLLRAEEAEATDFIASDAWVFVMPENCASLAGGMKALLDRVFYPIERDDTKQGTPFMAIFSAGNAGDGAQQQLASILKGINAKQAQPNVVVYGRPTDDDLAQMQRLGEAFSEALSMGVL